MPEQLDIEWESRGETQPVLLRRAYRYRLAPTKDQAKSLDGQRRGACRLYNAALQERRQGYCFGRTVRPRPWPNKTSQSRQITEIHADGNLGVAHPDIAHDVLRRVDEAFRAFFRRVKQGSDEKGFPRYQPIGRYDSFTYRREGPSCRVRDNGHLYVSGVGELRVQWHRVLPEQIQSITLKWDGKHWDVIFSCRVSRPILPPSDQQVGLDLGLKTYAARSDQDDAHPPIEPLKAYVKAQKTLARLQRELSRRTKVDRSGRLSGKQSHRREKTKALVRAAHARVVRQRQTFQHHVARQLVKDYGLIAIEDLKILGLARGMLAKQVSDASWGTFILKLEEKVQETGRQLIRVPPAGTSQTCLCGASVPKDLSVRWHACPTCGIEMDRDEMSAKVILQRALIQVGTIGAGSTPSGHNGQP